MKQVRLNAPSILVCTACGTGEFRIFRRRIREKNHIKTFYCFKCKLVLKHLEIRENSYEMLQYRENPNLFLAQYHEYEKRSVKDV